MPAHAFGRWLLATGLALVLAGCPQQKGDQPIASGEGKGDDWKPPAGSPKLTCIAIENYFTRDVTVEATGGGKHYVVTVGPVRKSYVIVPDVKYEIKAWTEERSTGGNFLHVTPFTRNGMNGLWVRIRF